MPSVGYKDADDPRVRSTYALICQRLGQDGLLQRYESGVDGFSGDEGAFGSAAFGLWNKWLSEASSPRPKGSSVISYRSATTLVYLPKK